MTEGSKRECHMTPGVEGRQGWRLSCAVLDLLGLTMWIGGFAALLTLVVPAVFNTLDMETGGRFLRRVFHHWHLLTGGIVVVFIGTEFVRRRQHRRDPARVPPSSRTGAGLVAVLAVSTCLLAAALGPRAAELQEAAFAAESPDAKRAALETFFQLHTTMRALHLFNAGVVVSLLVVKLRQWRPQ